MKSSPPDEKTQVSEWWMHPSFGQALLVASGLAYYFSVMLISLVGRAGQAVPYAAKNRAVFGAVLLLACALNGAAWRAKILRRRRDGSPYPYGAAALMLLGLSLLVSFLIGTLAL